MKKSIGMMVVVSIIVMMICPAVSEVNLEQECRFSYDSFRAGYPEYAVDGFEENAATFLGANPDGVIFAYCTEYSVPLCLDRSEYQDMPIQEVSPFSILAGEMEQFDAIMICRRRCDYWYLLEFVGFRRNNENGLLQVCYTEVLIEGFTLYVGNYENGVIAQEDCRLLKLEDTNRIVQHCLEIDHVYSAKMYRFMMQLLYNDAIGARYLHSDAQNLYEDTINKEIEWPHGTRMLYTMQRGTVALMNLHTHSYIGRPIGLEVHYVSTVQGQGKESDYVWEAAALDEMMSEDYPELRMDFPWIYFDAYTKDGQKMWETAVQSAVYKDSNIGL